MTLGRWFGRSKVSQSSVPSWPSSPPTTSKPSCRPQLRCMGTGAMESAPTRRDARSSRQNTVPAQHQTARVSTYMVQDIHPDHVARIKALQPNGTDHLTRFCDRFGEKALFLCDAHWWRPAKGGDARPYHRCRDCLRRTRGSSWSRPDGREGCRDLASLRACVLIRANRPRSVDGGAIRRRATCMASQKSATSANAQDGRGRCARPRARGPGDRWFT